MKTSIFLVFTCFLWFEASSQTRLNGNTLTLADGRTIQIGSYMKLSRPSKGSRYAYVFNELSLRSSSEDDLPFGMAGNISGKEVNVKRFLVRKGAKGEKIYVVTGGAFINNAIDIERALAAGEVLLPQKRPVFRDQLAADTKKADTAASLNTGTPTISSPGGSATKPLRKPWEDASGLKPLPTSRDSMKKQDTSQSLSGKFAREFKHTDSVNKAEISHPVLPPTLRTAPEPVIIATVSQSLRKDSILSSSTITPKISAAAETTAAVSNHDISTLMTVPAPEAVTPVESKIKAGGDKASGALPGYDKYTKLKQLKELLDAGVLSRQEFDAEKKKVLTGN